MGGTLLWARGGEQPNHKSGNPEKKKTDKTIHDLKSVYTIQSPDDALFVSSCIRTHTTTSHEMSQTRIMF